MVVGLTAVYLFKITLNIRVIISYISIVVIFNVAYEYQRYRYYHYHYLCYYHFFLHFIIFFIII